MITAESTARDLKRLFWRLWAVVVVATWFAPWVVLGMGIWQASWRLALLWLPFAALSVLATGLWWFAVAARDGEPTVTREVRVIKRWVS